MGKVFGMFIGFFLGSQGKFFGSLIGMGVGYMVGKFFDDMTKGQERKRSRIDFGDALLVLSAAVMTANNKVLKTELEYVKNYFVKKFGVNYAQESMLKLREILKDPVEIDVECARIRSSLHPATKTHLLHYLFGIAFADGQIDPMELGILQRIAGQIGISTRDYNSIYAMYMAANGFFGGGFGGQQQGGRQQYYRQTSTAPPNAGKLQSSYQILGVDKSVSDDDLKKAYRSQVKKHHPDRVAHLGEIHVKEAEERFKKIDEAYDYIKKSRGLN